LFDEKRHSTGTPVQRWIKKDTSHLQYYLITICCSVAAIIKIVKAGTGLDWMMKNILLVVMLTLFMLVFIRKTTAFMPEVREYYITQWKEIKAQEDRENNAKKSS